MKKEDKFVCTCNSDYIFQPTLLVTRGDTRCQRISLCKNGGNNTGPM